MMKKVLSVLLCISILAGFTTLYSKDGYNGKIGWIDAGAVEASSYKVGDIIEYGTYPQSRVTDAATISALNSKASGWKSYNYYEGDGNEGSMHTSDFMSYCDVKFGNNKYRGVTFDTYRPKWTYGASSTGNYCGMQYSNGYTYGTTYWFKFEPLRWRILDASTGFVVCETIIDSQAYSNTIKKNTNDGEYYNYKGSFASDWETSSLREWLNNDFYSTAFTQTQQSRISTSTLKNGCYYTLIGYTGHDSLDSATTNEKIFLLSYDEVINRKYGFSTRTDYQSSRQALVSDYAKCQGLYCNNHTGLTKAGWWLRSPGTESNNVCGVEFDGYLSRFYPYYTYYGVRPAMCLSELKDDYAVSEPVTEPEPVIEPTKPSDKDEGVIGTVEEKGYKQVHVVKNWDKENKDGAKKYLNKAGKALSNADYENAFVIPGQDKSMVPQGLAYWAAKDWFLVSSYNKVTEKEKKKGVVQNGSVIFAIDAKSGEFVAQFNICENRKDIVPATHHFGGLAVSDNNVYLTYYGSTFAYFPINEMNVAEGSVKNIKIRDKIDVSSFINNTNLAYMSISEGCIWTGNFYCTKTEDLVSHRGKLTNWSVPASKQYNSVMLGYKIQYDSTAEDKPADEWNRIKNTVNNKKYDYRINIPNKYDGVQGATIKDNTIFLSRAEYRLNNKNNNTMILAHKIVLDRQVKTLSKDNWEGNYNVPGAENIIIKNGKMYCVYESGALANRGEFFWTAGDRRATDVIWEIDANKMLKDVSLHVYNCPVDIEVVNKDTKEVVCKIKNNIIDEDVEQSEDALLAEVDGDSKMIWIPSDGNYEIVVTGNDNGTLDHSVSVFNENAEVSERKNFYDVDITEGLTLTGNVKSDNFKLKDYSLCYENGKSLKADEYFSNAEKAKLNITVSVQGNGDSNAPDEVLSGDYVSIDAFPGDGAEFLGWYENNKLLSTESTYSFVAKTNRKLIAKFSNSTSSSKLKVPSNAEVEYSATVTVKAKATDVPEGYYVALYDGKTLLAKGSNAEVSYTFPGEFTGAKNITVKIIDDKENVQKDGDGKDLTASFEVKAKSGFFAKLIAFFKRLFKKLPAVTVEPK